MWERFSYYGMRAILILFMTAEVTKGGLGFDTATAGIIYGLYTSLVYLLSVPGGWVADRLLGQQKAVLLGGVLIMIGQFTLGMHNLAAFYGGLGLIILGTGLLKPNISTIVGQLYGKNDRRRDSGFSIFYMGINLGALISPIIVGYVGQRINWNLAFALAGFGMLIGLIQYHFGRKNLGDAGLHPVAPANAEQAAAQQKLIRAGIAVFAVLVLLPAALAFTGAITLSPELIGNAFGVLLVIISIAIFASLLRGQEWNAVERKRFAAIGFLYIAACLFWSAFEQAGSTLNLFATRSTDLNVFGFDIPSSWFQSANSFFIVLGLAPFFAWLWVRLGSREPSSPAKFALGLLAVGMGYVIVAIGAQQVAGNAKVGVVWLVGCYFFHTVGELCISPVGLGAISKLAPARVAGLMMGVWFMSISVGNYIGGRVAGFYEQFAVSTLFWVVAAFSIGVGLIMVLLTPSIKRLMGGVN
jgi:POT family proton-dependent oligopeptide transporter